MTQTTLRAQPGTNPKSCPRPASDNRIEGAPGENVQALLAKFALLDEFYGRPERSPGSLTEVASNAVSAIGAASCAAVSVRHRGTLRVEAATHPVAGQLEQLQRRLNHGPTLDVLVGGQSHSMHLAGMSEAADGMKIDAPTGWFPDLADHLEGLGIGAVLSLRVTTGLFETRAALTVAAPADGTFTEKDFVDALTVARNAQGAVGAHQVLHLSRALQSSRDLGVAIGILMSRYRLTRGDALRLLRRASQERNRKANVLALQIIEIGELPDR